MRGSAREFDYRIACVQKEGLDVPSDFSCHETHMLILLTAKRVAPCLNKYLLGKATLVVSLLEDSGLSADTLTQSDALALLSLFDVHA